MKIYSSDFSALKRSQSLGFELRDSKCIYKAQCKRYRRDHWGDVDLPIIELFAVNFNIGNLLNLNACVINILLINFNLPKIPTSCILKLRW